MFFPIGSKNDISSIEKMIYEAKEIVLCVDLLLRSGTVV